MGRLRMKPVMAALCLLAAASGGGACRGSPGSAPPSPVPLEGTRWVLSEIAGRQATPGLGGEAVTVQFDPAVKRASGYAGVNRFTGSYELGGTSLRFGPLAATRRAGPPEAEELERAVFERLGATVAWRIIGASLELLDANGARLMRFDAGGASR